MRFRLQTLLAFLCSLILADAALAQSSQWQVLTQPGGYKVARVTGQGAASGLALTCERGTPVIALNLAGGPGRGPAALTISVDGSAFPVALVRNGTTNVWVAGVRDPGLVQAMADGSSARVMAGNSTIGAFSLAGASAAIGNALAPCYRLAAASPASTGAQPAAMPSGMPPLVDEGQGCPSIEPIKRWGKANVRDWMDTDSIFCGDFNGDGAPDAVAFVYYDLGGNSAGQVVALFQNVGGTLRFLRKVGDVDGQVAKAGFARGKVLVQMMVPRPGDARCCPTGATWQEIDVATGRPAAVRAPTTTATAPPRPAPASPRPAPATGPLSQIPMQLGYYVDEGDTCRKPYSVTKFEADGFWIVDSDGAFKERVARVTRQRGEYVLAFVRSAKDDEPGGAVIIPRGPGRIGFQINGDGELKRCDEAEIPAAFRR